MKNILWRTGMYKYRTALYAHINNVEVGVISWTKEKSRYNCKILLPGLPKATNSFGTLESAKSSIELRINEWFIQVQQ